MRRPMLFAPLFRSSWLSAGLVAAAGCWSVTAMAQPPVVPAPRPALAPPADAPAAGAAAAPAAAAPERDWTDSKGNMILIGSFVAANGETVVIQKPTGELIGVQLSNLSAADQKVVQELRLAEVGAQTPSQATRAEDQIWQPHLWTTRDGIKLKGRVTKFGRREVVFRRNTGVTMVNELPFRRLEPFYQEVALKLVAAMADPTVKTEADLNRWARSLRGQPKSFMVEGVMMRLEGGEEYPIPFFMLSDDDLLFLRPGWEQWKESDASEQTRQREDFLLQVQAEQYQLDRQQARQIQMMEMQYMAVATGITRIWEVQLFPAPGVFARPLAVMVNARDNVEAQQIAMANYPGFIAGTIRRISR